MIYFCHGVPGGPDDAQLLNIPDDSTVVAADFVSRGGLPNAVAQFDASMREHSAPINLVGFSIGAMIALHIAAARPDQIKTLTLISPAAPLQCGAFLDRMTGKPVFKLAKRSPFALRMLTLLQSVVLRIAPNALLKPLFARCGPEEKALLQDKAFHNILLSGLRNAYISNPATYAKVLTAYVSDWSDILAKITTPTTIWHGDADTWAPVEMAYALENQLSGPVTLHIIVGGEHYTTLTKADLT